MLYESYPGLWRCGGDIKLNDNQNVVSIDALTKRETHFKSEPWMAFSLAMPSVIDLMRWFYGTRKFWRIHMALLIVTAKELNCSYSESKEALGHHHPGCDDVLNECAADAVSAGAGLESESACI
ncbi:hypothetical protein BGY98DRAFT_1178347 [Russula aff. rugulosa BPL654]|nr:hypothetical protein BGY98DRAFT_1178347 [Russula aff. rugulosa BPL654]